MTNQAVQVLGVDKANRALAHVVGRIDVAASATARTTADRVASSTRSRVPKRSGTLAASVQVLGIAHGALVEFDDQAAPYAGWIEFGGTRGRPYVPGGRYLNPSAEAALKPLVAAMEATTRTAIASNQW